MTSLGSNKISEAGLDSFVVTADFEVTHQEGLVNDRTAKTLLVSTKEEMGTVSESES
jgi:hypothetical protein